MDSGAFYQLFTNAVPFDQNGNHFCFFENFM